MTLVVVDASAALAWALPSQSTAASVAFISQAERYEFIAPAIFHFEVFNVLVKHRRRGLIDDGAYRSASEILGEVNIDLEAPLLPVAVEQLAAYAQVIGLGLFDAGYLKLALELDATLASRDKALLGAAVTWGVTVHDLRDPGEIE
ncbi:MAG: PilT protein domain protein [Caulobacter sp.]|nr:PilT protein domain protein [Caulobacter sp.]